MKRSITSMSKNIGVLLLATIIGAFCVELGERLAVPGVYGLVSTAEARVGRPLTPVSVAGAARRTARRCAAGVYYC
jgi:hypothetical protein